MFVPWCVVLYGLFLCAFVSEGVFGVCVCVLFVVCGVLLQGVFLLRCLCVCAVLLSVCELFVCFAGD